MAYVLATEHTFDTQCSFSVLLLNCQVSIETSPLLNNWIKAGRNSGVDESPAVPQVTIIQSASKSSASHSSPSMDESRSTSKGISRVPIFPGF